VSVHDRIAVLQQIVCRILWEDWDPIGVNDIPEAAGEYDSYAPGIAGMLVRGVSAHDLDFHLSRIEEDSMGLPSRPPSYRAKAIASLIALRDAG
jgi:hypothetical protein